MSHEQDDDPSITDHLSADNGLRVVPRTDKGHPPTPDPELKAMLDDLNRRYRVQRERIENEDDTPDAA